MYNTEPLVTPSPITSPAPKRWVSYSRLLERVGPLGFYALIAVLFSWPLALHLSDSVISQGNSGDVWQHLWNSWWMRFSLLNLHTHPYYTPTLLYPNGANLYFHALDPLDGYLSTPLQLIFGLVAAFNLNILFQITVAGWGAYALAHYLTGHRAAALVAGLIYACSPLESLFVNLGQLELSSIEWLPLYILCLIKALGGVAPPWLWRGLSVAFLLVLSLDSWYYVMYALLFTGLYSLYHLGRKRANGWKEWRRTILLVGGIGLTYLILVLPILLPTLHEAGAKGTTQGIFNVIYNSATVRGLFTTGPSLLWGLFGSANNDQFRGNFLGYVTLLLAGLGLVAGFRRNWFWAVVGGVFLVLAFGPVFHVSFDPDWRPETANSGLQLPGYWLYNLPLGNISRVPLRFALITGLALAILAAYGLAWLSERTGRIGWTKWAWPTVAGLLVLLEFLPGSRPLADSTVPAFYTQLRSEGQWNDFAVLETPDRGNATIISRAMYYQTTAQHPMVGGYLSRKPQYDFQNYPGIADLLNLDFGTEASDILGRASLANTLGVLQFYKIRYVIVHPTLLDQVSQERAAALLGTVFGPTAKPYYQDKDLQAWRVPDTTLTTTPPDPSRVLVALNGEWDKPTKGTNGPTRSFKRMGRLQLFNPYPQPLKVNLKATSVGATQPGKLTASLNGQTLGQTDLTSPPAPLNLSFTLQPGLNELVLQSAGAVTLGPISLLK